MIEINSVLLPVSSEINTIIDEPHVVVYGSYSRGSVFLINLVGVPKKPLKFLYSIVLEALNCNELETATLTKPEIFNRPDIFLSRKIINKRDAIYDVIFPLVSDIDSFFYSEYGSQLVARLAKENNKTRYQIYQWFYKYLRYGQTKSAVTPNYTNTGSSKTNKATSKIGAARKNSRGEIGKNVDEPDKNNMLKILKKLYWKENGMPLTSCLEEMDRLYYTEGKTIDHNGDFQVILKHENERISIDQLRYWEKKLANQIGIKTDEVRSGKTRYAKDKAGRSGDKEVAQGPGHIYEIDSTPNDYESVSVFSKERNQIVGRANVYAVRDGFSTGFTGLHITLEAPSYDTARLTLFNTFRNKVSYCREYGLEINPDDWPQEGKPIKLVADNAELRSNLAGSVTKDSGLVIRFSREYRGDDKGLVEQAFALYFASLRGKVDGYIDKTSTERGTPEPKQKALFTMNEFAKILIKFVIHYNKTHPVNPNQLDKAVVSAGINLTPNSIWNWGLKYRPFYRKSIDEKELYVDLLTVGSATAKREGIVFKKLYYNSPELAQSGLLDRMLVKHTSLKIEIRFMQHNMNHIWLQMPDGNICVSLAVQSRRFKDCSLNEISQQLAREAEDAGKLKKAHDNSMASYSENIENMTKQAKAEQTPITLAAIRSQSVASNRQCDIEHEQQKEAFRYENFATPYADNDTSGNSTLQSPEQNNESEHQAVEEFSDKRKQQYSSIMDDMLLKKENK